MGQWAMRIAGRGKRLFAIYILCPVLLPVCYLGFSRGVEKPGFWFFRTDREFAVGEKPGFWDVVRSRSNYIYD
ncbi:hypothetical protein [Brunnivagina elsteri]|uniref:Uncharacterized protein n=1 Tax=Brunnivagina elsteri CCALA 953 TaxID=987040 RepID=A0A2A2TQG0_9CYAN|nr:hypothetical protein [Calothrix elsteri]PAX60665.1 hypothetical protein CK510_00640 [Calothrix elsteri CCALA 953]